MYQKNINFFKTYTIYTYIYVSNLRNTPCPYTTLRYRPRHRNTIPKRHPITNSPTSGHSILNNTFTNQYLIFSLTTHQEYFRY